MEQIAGYNNKNAEGAAYPCAVSQLHFWLSLFEQVTDIEEASLISLCFISNEFDWIKEPKSEPPFIFIANEQQVSHVLIDSAKTLPRNARYLKIVPGDINWIEFSIKKKVLKLELLAWLPVPSAFNDLIWKAIRFKGRGKVPFNSKTIAKVRRLFLSKLKPSKNLPSNKKATLKAWQSYLSTCFKRDEELSKSARALLLSDHHQYNESTIHYIQGSTCRLRAAFFHSANRYINRVIGKVHNFDLSHYFKFESSTSPDKPTITSNTKLASYLENNDEIFDISRQTENDRTWKKIIKGQLIYGATTIPSEKLTAAFIVKMKNNIENMVQTKYKNKSEWIELNNKMTCSLALLLVIATGVRPTHAIAPLFEHIGKNSFTIKDKGIAREILLSPLLREQLVDYQAQTSRLLLQLYNYNKADCFITINVKTCEFKPLNAKNIRHFTNELAQEIYKEQPTIFSQQEALALKRFVPYLFRRTFASQLSKLSTPSQVIDELLGHYTYGEQSGHRFSDDQKTKSEYLNETQINLGIQTIFKFKKAHKHV